MLGGDLPQEAQGPGLVSAAFLALPKALKRLLRAFHSAIEASLQQVGFAQPDEHARMVGHRGRRGRVFHGLPQQGDGLGRASSQGIRIAQLGGGIGKEDLDVPVMTELQTVLKRVDGRG